jgi:hypothetical protein
MGVLPYRLGFSEPASFFGGTVRRLVVEVYGPELADTIERSPGLRQVRAFEVLQLLRYDAYEFVGICRIELKEPNSRFLEAFRQDPATSELAVLHREDDGSFVVLLKRRPAAGPVRPRLIFGGEVTRPGSGYLLAPLGYRNGRLRYSFLGNERQIREILGKAGFSGYRYRVVSLKEARFFASPLDQLTRRQRLVLETAYQLGWYDVPRRVSSATVAKRLDLRAGTVVEHLRKAERRLLVGMLGER